MDVRIGGMTLCDYFSAADDHAAAVVAQTPGGPGQAAFDVGCSSSPVSPMIRW